WMRLRRDGRQWYAFGLPKGKRTRVVPVPASLIMAINAHVARYGLSEEGTIASMSTGHAWNPSAWDKAWRKAPEAVGSEMTGAHQLRLVFGSSLSAAGESTPNVSKWMGHASIATTLRTYVHPEADAAPSVDLLAHEPRTNRALNSVLDVQK